MASIVKRGSNYCVVYRQHRISGKTKQKWETYHSEELAIQRKFEIENTQPLFQTNRVPCINELLDEFIEIYGTSNWSFSTYSSRIAIIDNYIRPHIGDMRITGINRKLISQYFFLLNKVEKVQNKYKPSSKGKLSLGTKRDIRKLLHTFFEQGIQWGYFESNPVSHIKIPKSVPPPYKYLLPDKVALLINEAYRKKDILMALILQLAFICSMRKSEILALCWDSISFEEQSIYVNKEIVRVTRSSLCALNHRNVFAVFPSIKSESNTVSILKEPKTISSTRTVYLPRSVTDILQLWKTKQTKHKNDHGLEYNDYGLAIALENGLPLSNNYIQTRFTSLLTVCKLPKVTFHSLRHSSTSYKLLLSNGDIKTVQGDNGHAQPNMVLSIYAHINDVQRKLLSQKIEDDFCSQLQFS